MMMMLMLKMGCWWRQGERDKVEHEDKNETWEETQKDDCSIAGLHFVAQTSTQDKKKRGWGHYCLTFDGPDAGVFIRKDKDNMTQCILCMKGE